MTRVSSRVVSPWLRTPLGAALDQMGAHLEATVRLALGSELADVDRPAVAWRHLGPAVEPHRAPVVLLNGWSASGSAWPDTLLDRLTAERAVLTIDHRGSGGSRRALAPFTIATLAGDVADVLCATSSPPAIVVGYSMGGMVAQELAIRQPHLVHRLVLVSTSPPHPAMSVEPSPARTALVSARRRGESVGEHLHRTWAPMLGERAARRSGQVLAPAVVAAEREPTSWTAGRHQLRAIASWHGPHRLAAIAAPTSVVHGADDPIVPVADGRRVARSIPHASFVELAGVGHLAHLEAPDELAAEVKAVSPP